MSNSSIFIGWDPREAAAFAVARESVNKYAPRHWPVYGLVLSKLKGAGLYSRAIQMRPGVDHPVMWDVISDAVMSTEHACARFLVPHLARHGWSLFMDGDMMVRADLAPLFDSLDPKFAVYCVKHNHAPTQSVKMDGQVQSRYARKNWSSFMVFNCELDPAWNFLVGHSDPAIVPKCIHWTSGTPDMRGYEDAPFAEEWRAARDDWAAGKGPAFQGW